MDLIENMLRDVMRDAPGVVGIALIRHPDLEYVTFRVSLTGGSQASFELPERELYEEPPAGKTAWTCPEAALDRTYEWLLDRVRQHRKEHIMPKYRKKPVIIDAFRLPAAGEAPDAFLAWAEQVGFTDFVSDRDEGIAIETLEGTMRADPGDWVIRGVKGEFYPCKNEIFELTYEPADVL